MQPAARKQQPCVTSSRKMQDSDLWLTTRSAAGRDGWARVVVKFEAWGVRVKGGEAGMDEPRGRGRCNLCEWDSKRVASVCRQHEAGRP